ncbi:MAG: 50S ribosomal protein L16 [Candidatus Altiarchaeota archaeon]|nr:50S ribosomal protein L16 [Candidatus Altiarchaeota archaeon]
MGLRPAKCYQWDSPAYTRVANNPGDSFITGIPGSKLNRFEMGNLSAEFDTEVSIAADEDIQMRSNALEAARITANKVMEEGIGVNNYRLKVRVFPHHVIRENVMATGAGADRVQMGMRQSFGKPMGTAARMKRGQQVLTIYLNKSDEFLKTAKKALKCAARKMPGETRLVIAPVKKKKKKK